MKWRSGKDGLQSLIVSQGQRSAKHRQTCVTCPGDSIVDRDVYFLDNPERALGSSSVSGRRLKSTFEGEFCGKLVSSFSNPGIGRALYGQPRYCL